MAICPTWFSASASGPWNSFLFDWALSIAMGEGAWKDSQPLPWAKEVERFFATLGRFDDYFEGNEALHASPEVADMRQDLLRCTRFFRWLEFGEGFGDVAQHLAAPIRNRGQAVPQQIARAHGFRNWRSHGNLLGEIQRPLER